MPFECPIELTQSDFQCPKLRNVSKMENTYLRTHILLIWTFEMQLEMQLNMQLQTCAV